MVGFVLRKSALKFFSKRPPSVFQLLRHASGGGGVIKSRFPDVEVPSCTLPEYVFDNISGYSDKTAFECCVTGRKYTYDELKIKSRNLNRSLRKKLKLQANDVVAVLLPNVPEYPIVTMGVLLAGLVVTPMNPLYTPDEIRKQLADSGAKALITLSELYPTIRRALEHTDIKVVTINNQSDSTTPQGTISFKEFVDNEVDISEVNISSCDNVAVMPYSSGTTGLPKGVLLSHRNLVANLKQLGAPGFNFLTEGEDHVVPAVLPLFHIYGFTSVAFASLLAGSKVVTLPKFTTELYLNVLNNFKPTVLFAVPPIVIFLYAHPSVKKEMLQSVRTLVSGAAPLGALDEQKFKEKIEKPVHILQGYGLSEASPVVTLVPYMEGPKPGSTGCLVPNTEVKIVPVDNPGAESLGPHKTGELLLRGPQVMLGYHNRPKETQDTLVDGWLRTGDMFYYDENESFYVADRIKELIKVKGFQVPPAELEEIIRDYPNVADAAVIGIPHDIYGEVPRAYVVSKPNTKVDMQKLDEFIAGKVTDYKRIRGGIVLSDAIPKNPSGKILRRQLKESYLNEQNK